MFRKGVLDRFARSAAIVGLISGAVALLPPPAFATPHNAHQHYLIGVRAQAGTRHAAMLHLEASSEGCDLVLARENAVEMERLAHEILGRLDRLQSLLPADESATIEPQLRSMTTNALTARRLSAELGLWIDVVLGVAAPTPAELSELSTKMVARSRELFATFGDVLRAHKAAETALGIPVPPDPPAP